MSSIVCGATLATSDAISSVLRPKLGGDHLSKRSDNSRTAASPRLATSAMMLPTVLRTFASASSCWLASVARFMCGGIGSSYSMTSSAVASSNGGTVNPSAWAVFMLITSSKRVGWATGRSAGIHAAKDLSGINPELAKRSRNFQPAAHQTTDGYEFAHPIAPRNCVARRQRHDLIAPACKKRVGAYEQRAGLPFGEGGEGAIYVAFATGV